MPPILPAFLVARWLLILVLAAGVYFFSGFILPVLAALIIGFASWPLYARLVRRCGGRTLPAASLALLIVLLVLVAPLSLALSYAIEEAGNLIGWLVNANRDGLPPPGWIASLPLVGERLAGYWQAHLGAPQGPRLGGLSDNRE